MPQQALNIKRTPAENWDARLLACYRGLQRFCLLDHSLGAWANWSDSQDCNSDYVSGHSLASGRTQSSGPVLGHRHGPLKECSGQNNDVTGLFV